MGIREFHVLPLTRAQVPLCMEAPRGALAARALNGAAIGEHQPESALNRAPDALRPEPLIQQMSEPRGRVCQGQFNLALPHFC